MIEFECSCGKPLQAEDQHAGRKTKCPACGTERTIPTGPAGLTPDGSSGGTRSSGTRPRADTRTDDVRAYDKRPLTAPAGSDTTKVWLIVLVLVAVAVGLLCLMVPLVGVLLWLVA